MQTLAVRQKQLEESTLAVARWCVEQPEVESVLHPALPTCPGHAIWQRDFTGSASVFSVVFAPQITADSIIRFIDSLSLFNIGYSRGGVTSLAMPHFNVERRYHAYGSRLVRFNIGLEAVDDLLADLERGFAAMRA